MEDDTAKSGLTKRIQLRQIEQTMAKTMAESKIQDKFWESRSSNICTTTARSSVFPTTKPLPICCARPYARG